MSDLVQKLRGHQHHPDRDHKLRCFDCEAADRIEELEAQLAEYKNKPATGLQWIETVDKHNALKKQLASVRPLVHKWRSKPYRSEMSIRLSNELEAAIGEKKDG